MSENLQSAIDTSSAPPPSDAAPDIFRHIDNPITGSGDEQIVREATRQREREWEQGVGGPDPFAEQRAPVVERKYDGRDKSSRTLRQASTEVSWAKTLERPDAQLAKAAGLTDQQVLAAAKDPAWVKANTGWTRQEVDEYVRTGETPAVPIVPFDEKRGFMEQLRDHEPVLGRPAHESLTLSEATRQSKNAREVVELTRQELARQEDEALALLQQAKSQEAAPAPQAQPTPAPQQPRPDPLAAEKQRLAFEAQALDTATTKEDRLTAGPKDAA